MNRRSFIIIGGAAGILLTTGAIKYINKSSSDALSTPETLLYLFGNDEVVLLGKEYLNNNSKVDSVEGITNLLIEDIDIENLASSEIKQELLLKIKDDFKKEKTVVVRGLIISNTEAIQCALFSKF